MFICRQQEALFLRPVEPCLAHHKVLSAHQESGVACKDGYLKERMGTEMPMLRLLITLTTGPINSPSSGLIVLSRVIQWTMALDIRETAL